jgi:hypothetical protein
MPKVWPFHHVKKRTKKVLTDMVPLMPPQSSDIPQVCGTHGWRVGS